ncbi:MBL fold metallo-hydrolase [Corynebacterium epidermidicanis]|uniref:Zn-dependent hydrolase, glyoxylase n=1 Tax=Corynebacterium epidermidicanis TaxID=1050174 RepID=A0A0G3GP61_9CORY|nr:MBL fold metallo-hydrolase [Corynebacterium epidermidicanis]AKK03016.1 Zn-dependent hydrolase, glyoxylase [Corynebacterium epidermidicanis]
MNLTLDHISVSDMDNNCYLLIAGPHALLIDAADSPDDLLRLAEQHNTTITHVLTTHRHSDHVRALPAVLEATGATHIASFLDAPALPAPVDIALNHGDTFTFAGHEFHAIILRGHTPGGLAFAATIDDRTHLFVGDSLFPGGVGKTGNENEFARLLRDVTERIFDVFPDDTIVHPGHGAPTTLGAERPHLDEWRERGW